ncbi:MAG: sensor histidine kinase [Gemmatimonadota bacterium]
MTPGAQAASESRVVRPLQALLRIPLFYKIVLGNAAIVVLGAAVGTMLTLRMARVHPGAPPLELVSAFIAVGLVVSMAVNGLLVRLALRPLTELEVAAERVKDLDLAARVPLSIFADAKLARLIRLFNQMVESLAESRRGLRELAIRAFEAEERERSRIARELHDGTAQALALLLVQIEIAMKRLGREGCEAAHLGEVRRLAQQTLQDVRRTARGLRPPELAELGVAAALQAHARLVEETTGLEVDFAADPVEPCLSSQAKLAVYRVVQEALSNVVKHADASSVRIRITHEPREIVAEVIDDGHGFDVAAASRRAEGSLGLFGMRERAAYVGGRVSVESRPAGGARVRMTIPCVHEDDPGGM